LERFLQRRRLDLRASLATHRLTELAQPVPERASQLGEAPRTEHEQCDDADEDEMYGILEAHRPSG
jgi:hypothetical protein